ncbi:hypothetical protein [Francisella philomiragia]|uniref:hypothetical protein n=1 Tax=Francisella philomiragia TaxID=28110 RepID=UPI0019080AE9|nr:hypothetical protein [Francisella philomiragia]MBK2105627.1 hypothetical protein [Francisella philomiragia]
MKFIKRLFVLVLIVTITSYVTINNNSNVKNGVLVGSIVGAILGLIWSVITLSILLYPIIVVDIYDGVVASQDIAQN